MTCAEGPREHTHAQYFRNLFDSAGVGLLTVDEQLRVRSCNAKAAELLGLYRDDITGQAFPELLGSAQHNIVEKMLRQALESGEYSEFEFGRDTGDASARYLAVTISPVLSEQGHSLGASACLRDITRRIRTQDQAGQDRKMRALGAMAGSLAHHFNNILGGIVTSVDFARDSTDIRLMRKTLNNAAKALQRATTLLDGLLAFAEADFRDEDYADLTETLLSFAEDIEPRLEQQNIDLELTLSEVPVVAVPKNHLQMVLHNVVNNSIDAMPSGGQLRLELLPGNGEVICRITDSGPGFAADQIEKVFEPFYSTKLDPRGDNHARHHGLGLSVALGIIHEIGGSIVINSEPGASAVVEIRLPTEPRRNREARADDGLVPHEHRPL